MITYMEELSASEAENLKKTISRLFRQTCILQLRYDPVTLTPRDNPDYESWLSTYAGKETDVEELEAYYPHEYKTESG